MEITDFMSLSSFLNSLLVSFSSFYHIFLIEHSILPIYSVVFPQLPGIIKITTIFIKRNGEHTYDQSRTPANRPATVGN